jgi:hypothetical protein
MHQEGVKLVEAWARLKSRWRRFWAFWRDWWEKKEEGERKQELKKSENLGGDGRGFFEGGWTW